MEQQRPHALLIDDDPLMRRLFGSHLASLGFEMIYANNGYEGWEMARRFAPACIFLDISMPDINGIDLAGRLKNEETTKAIPIIILTNADITNDAERALKEAGILECIHKGMGKDEFFERVKAILPLSSLPKPPQ